MYLVVTEDLNDSSFLPTRKFAELGETREYHIDSSYSKAFLLIITALLASYVFQDLPVR